MTPQRPIAVRRIDPNDPVEVDAVLDLDQLVWADDLRTPREAALADTPTRAAAGYVTGDPAAIDALDAALRTPVLPVGTIDF